MEELRKILEKACPDTDFTRTDLITGGYIDSLKFIILLDAIEEAYGITIDLDDIEPENFESLASMYKLIESRK